VPNMKKISLAIATIIALLVLLFPGCRAPAPDATYTSATLGLSMRYPEGWVHEEGGEQVILGTSEEIIGGAQLEAGVEA